MELRSEIKRGVLVISVCENRIDAAAALQFKDGMRRATQSAPNRVILDLSEVNFVDSSGLGAIVGVMKQLAPDRTLEIACLSTTVAKVFALTRMDKIFTLHGDLDGAFAEARA